MNRRSQLLIAGTLILLGIGVFSLGFLEEESKVRYVHQIHEDPLSHQTGDYTLLSVPQPNAEETVYQTKAGTTITSYQLTHESGDALTWNLTVTVQQTNRSTPDSVTYQSFMTPTYAHVFPVQDFGENGPMVWAVYDGVLPEELRPKPSQLEGRLLETPEGALIYEVETLTIGCSSKFIPEENRDEFDADGDGYADSEVE